MSNVERFASRTVALLFSISKSNNEMASGQTYGMTKESGTATQSPRKRTE